MLTYQFTKSFVVLCTAGSSLESSSLFVGVTDSSKRSIEYKAAILFHCLVVTKVFPAVIIELFVNFWGKSIFMIMLNADYVMNEECLLISYDERAMTLLFMSS